LAVQQTTFFTFSTFQSNIIVSDWIYLHHDITVDLSC